MESSEGSDSKTNPGKSETKSGEKSGQDLPGKSPPTYTSSILPQAMPTEGFSLPSGPYESGSSRGHSPYEYEYGQSSYAQAPSSEPMYPSYDLSGPGAARRPSGGILPASSEAFSSLGSGGAFQPFHHWSLHHIILLHLSTATALVLQGIQVLGIKILTLSRHEWVQEAHMSTLSRLE